MASQPARVLWKRLPTFFPYIKMVMYPLSEDQKSKLLTTGYLAEAAFKTTPNVNKLEIKEFLEKVYRLPVLSVHTAIYEGKKRRAGRVTLQKPSYKKVWVKMHTGGLLTGTSVTHEQVWKAEMATVKDSIAKSAAAK